MKKLIALLLVIIMCVGALAGCGGGTNASVVGKWKYVMEYDRVVESLMDQAQGTQAVIYEQMIKAFDGVSLPLIFELSEDGTIAVSPDSQTSADVTEQINQRIAAAIPSIFEAMGVSTEAMEQYLTSMGMTLDQYVEMISQSMNPSFENAKAKYRVDGDKLYILQDDALEGSAETYVVFEVTDTELKITEISEGSENIAALLKAGVLPMVLTRAE